MSRIQRRVLRAIPLRNCLAVSLAASFLLTTVAPPTLAASGSWTGATSNVWQLDSNWSAAPFPSGADIGTFDGAGNANTTIDLDPAGLTVGGIAFDTASAAAYTIGSGGAGLQALGLGTPGTAINMNAAVANNQLVNANLALATTGNYVVQNNSTTNLLTLAGGISTTSAGIKRLEVDGAGNTTITGAITAGTGTVNLHKLGTGTLTLSGGGAFAGNGVPAQLPASANHPVVIRSGATVVTGGAYTIATGQEWDVGANDSAGGAGSNVSFTMNGGTWTSDTWFSIARGNGTGTVSSDVVLNNNAALTSGNFGLGFNAGSALNMPRGSVTLNNTSSVTVAGTNRTVNMAESAGSNGTFIFNNASTFTAADATVSLGFGGTATLTLNDSASFSSNGASRLVRIGRSTGGSGKVTLNGTSTFNHTGATSGTRVGDAGVGVFDIASSTATASVRNFIIGNGTNGVGAVYNRGTIKTFGLDGIFMGDGNGSSSYFRNDNAAAATPNDTANQIVVGIGTNPNAVLDVISGTLNGNRAGFGFFQNTNINGQYNILGGTLGTLGTGATQGFRVGETTTQTGNKFGNVNVVGSGQFTNASTVNLSVADLAGNSGLLSVTGGGKVTADVITAGGANPTAIVAFDNGTLQASAGLGTDLVSANIDRVQLNPGGATIDTNGFNKTIAANIAAPAGDGVQSIALNVADTAVRIGRPIAVISGGGGTGATAYADWNPTTGAVTGIVMTSPGSGYTSAPTVLVTGGIVGGAALATTPTLGATASTGGLTKVGTGVLTTSGANTYGGATNVNAGTLLVNGSHTGGGAYTVGAGATLGGTGSIGASSVIVNGNLAPGASVEDLAFNLTGQLDVSAAAAGSLLFELDTPAASDKVVITSGTLNIGTLNFADFAFSPLTNFVNGTYTLFDASSPIVGTIGGSSSGTIGFRTATLSIDSANNDVVLSVVPEPTSFLLFGLGALLIGGLRRRSR